MRRSMCSVSIFLAVVLLLTGCAIIPPDDEISVEWKRGVYTDSLMYKGEEYKIFDSPFNISHTKMTYMGQLFSRGSLGRMAPIKAFGIPVLSGYSATYAFYQDGKENPVIISPEVETVWLSTEYCLEPAEQQSFKAYEIQHYDGETWTKKEFLYEQGISFDDLKRGDSFVLDSKQEKSNTGLCIVFRVDGIECLWCRFSIFLYNGLYCIPTSMNEQDWYASEVSPLCDEWQRIVSDYVDKQL